MLGYVTCEKAELKMRDYELYNGYYCGVCKSIGERYGQIPRMVLSYDAAFLALVLAGVGGEEESISREHCIIHHIKKKTVVRNEAIDYAADVMLILAWYKILDDVQDEGKFRSKVATKFFKRRYRELEEKRPRLCQGIRDNLKELIRLEEEKCDSLDRVAHTFASIMEEIFYLEGGEEETNRLLKALGYHLGKWIYLMDAWEDIEENIKSGAYNPLLHRFKRRKEEPQENFRKRIYDDVERNLLIYLSEMSKIVDLLELGRNKDIIENVVYMGLLRRTEKALGKEEGGDGESLRNIRHQGRCIGGGN